MVGVPQHHLLLTRHQDVILRRQIDSVLQRHPKLRGTPKTTESEVHFAAGEQRVCQYLKDMVNKGRNSALTRNDVEILQAYVDGHIHSVYMPLNHYMYLYGVESVVETIQDILEN